MEYSVEMVKSLIQQPTSSHHSVCVKWEASSFVTPVTKNWKEWTYEKIVDQLKEFDHFSNLSILIRKRENGELHVDVATDVSNSFRHFLGW